MAKITGDYPPIERVETGLYTLDRALGVPGSLGLPMTILEIFGFQGIGKTTALTSLAGIVAEKMKKSIVYVPFEHVDRDYMGNILDSIGCEQEVSIVGGLDTIKRFTPTVKAKERKDITHEMMLDCMLEAMRLEEFGFSIVDSLSAFASTAEMESSVADRNMGRARAISDMSRMAVNILRQRETPFCFSFLSHKTVVMGGGTPSNTGTATTGGEIKKNLAKVRIGLRRMPEPTMYEKENNAYILEGKVEKNNFGKDKTKFFLAILGGKGIHYGLTAMYECKMLKLATFGASITLGKEKFGRMETILNKAHEGDDEFFQPFVDALHSRTGKVENTEEELEDWEEAAE